MKSVTRFFSIYINHFLQPLAQNVPTYIRDGTHLLDTLKAYTWETTYQWVSLDVNSLYTSILHNVGLRSVQNFLLQDPLINPKQANFIVDSTKFCLTHNYFSFDNKFYLQTQGTAMGANFAPIYANLTMGFLEHLFIWNDNPFSKHIVFIGRYID